MSLYTDFKRIVKTGFINFKRNGMVTFASVLVMTITLSIAALLIVSNALLSFLLVRIQDKVDINVYFVPTAQEEQVLEMKTVLEGLPEVSEVEYISREQAYIDFTERHKDDALIQRSLDELDANPLGAVLNISAKDPSNYGQVSEFIESKESLLRAGVLPDIIERKNYHDTELVIERLGNINEVVKKGGLAVTVFFVIISLMIAFNTLRLGIFVYKEEISIMRLVGADNKYIQGPFLVEGILYGVIASLLSMIAFYFAAKGVGPALTSFFEGFDIFNYYLSNFWQLFALLLAGGCLLGIISSFIAIRRYLKV